MSEELVKNPFFGDDEDAYTDVPTACLQIEDWVGEYLARSEDTYIDRASSANNCVKQRWYKARGSKATSLTPRKRVNFMMGDIAEMCLAFFIKNALVGPGKLYSEVDFGKEKGSFWVQKQKIIQYEQLEWHITVEGLEVSGHPDGVGKRNSDGKWELIEIKSAANYGFGLFREAGAGDYLKQAHALFLAKEAKKLSIDTVRFFYLRKETGHIWDHAHKYQYEISKGVQDEFLAAHGDEMAAPHGLTDEYVGQGRGKPKVKTGRKIAKFPCSYCGFMEECQGKFKKEFSKRNKSSGAPAPIFVFEGEKE